MKNKSQSPQNNDHQTEHLWVGFIGDPSGQLNVWENSFRLETGPITLNCAGLWDPTCTLNFKTSGLYLPHQTLAALIQNNCFGVYLSPGSGGSGPWSFTYSWYAYKNIVLFVWGSKYSVA